MRTIALVALVACVAAVFAMPIPRELRVDEELSQWIPVPGGQRLHRSCVHHVPDGYLVDKDKKGNAVLVGPMGDKIAVPPCKFRKAPRQLPQDQVYAIDTHYTPATELMHDMNTTWVTPGLPPEDQSQVNYLWPGFKSTEPTMGLPVLQPVLQYGQDCGTQWCVKSWFVWGDQGQAFQSTAVMLNVGDTVTSYMSLNNQTQTWTIYARRTSTGEDTTLNIAYSQACDCDYHVAMLVLETIMPPNTCSLLPSTPTTFSNVIVNGKKQSATAWVKRVTLHDCNDAIQMTSSTVTFSYSNSAHDDDEHDDNVAEDEH